MPKMWEAGPSQKGGLIFDFEGFSILVWGQGRSPQRDAAYPPV